MTEDLAITVSDISSMLITTRNLMQNESRAKIPDKWIEYLNYLISKDTNARQDFYKVIRALATKYNKIYKEQLKNI